MATGAPGYRNQRGMRTVFRIVGVLAMGAALVLIGLAVADFFAAFNSDGSDTPTRMWTFFVALPLFIIGGFCLQAGFAGAGARYAAGEVAPVARDTLSYLRDEPAQARCPSCGQPIPSGGRFCSSCGTAVG